MNSAKENDANSKEQSLQQKDLASSSKEDRVDDKTEFNVDTAIGASGQISLQHNQENSTTSPPEQKKLSKNQLKKKRKWERAMEVKKRRKQQEKDIKLAKAKAEGRDLEEEKRLLKQRTEEGIGKQRRQAKWEATKLPLVQKSFKVCLDCSYESVMTPKEINSLSSQIRYCYAANRKSDHPCYLSVSSLTGTTLDHLKNVSGFEEWNQRAFSYSEKPVEQLYSDQLDHLIYLTSDSENTVQDLDDSKIYIIGGIVDRNRLKRAAIERAEKLGIVTAKLPLDQYLQKMESTRVLTCNHVFETLLQYRAHGKDWGKALMQVLPHRKDVKPIEAPTCPITSDPDENS